MAAKPRPQVNMFPGEDKDFGGYTEAVQCIHCRRWMKVDFDRVYFSETTGKRQHIQIFKEMNWDGWDWYISNRTHNPAKCGHKKDNEKFAKKLGYKNYKAMLAPARW